MEAHQPPIIHGRRIKLRYAHQGGRCPPRVIIHGSQPGAVPDAYQRYLANVFRKSFELYATPVVVEFRGSVNPFLDKKNQHKVGYRPKRAGGTGLSKTKPKALTSEAKMKLRRKARKAKKT